VDDEGGQTEVSSGRAEQQATGHSDPLGSRQIIIFQTFLRIPKSFSSILCFIYILSQKIKTK